MSHLNPMPYSFPFFFFNDTATTEIYTLSLHDALPISWRGRPLARGEGLPSPTAWPGARPRPWGRSIPRSEEHTSELQSRLHLVCRLLLEKKKKQISTDERAHTTTVYVEAQRRGWRFIC